MPDTEPAPTRRRTQAERRSATRAALLDATIAELEDTGYAGLTVKGVADRAGLSRGAQVHHFPTKAKLVAAAVAYLAARQAEQILAEAETVSGGAERVDAVLDLLWESLSGPLFAAGIDLWVAGRTDPELREQLLETQRLQTAALTSNLRRLFGPYAEHEAYAVSVETALATMAGLALAQLLGAEPADAERRWREIRPGLRRMFTDPAPA